MSYIDTHGHLYREYYLDDLDVVINRAINADVTKIILPCVNAYTINDLFDISNKYPKNLFPLIGLHPTDVRDDYKTQLKELELHIDDSGILGIGEIGLDLYHDEGLIEIQKEAFTTQLNWAKDNHLPISLHIRNAYSESISILKTFKEGDIVGILHCFSGGIQEAKWAIDRGFKLGIGGVVTFKKNKLVNIIQEVGIQHIVLETDAPFLAPEPHRGKRNESAYIPLIAERISQILDLSIEDVRDITTKNAHEIFGDF